MQKLQQKRNKEVKYDNSVNHLSLFGFTIKAISESWGVPENDVVEASMLELTKWKPVINVYLNEYSENVKYPVALIIHPNADKNKIYKQYEEEIKRGIGIPQSQEFDIVEYLGQL
ncbi:MAG TPA: hypothetical protein VK518_04775 [Puia sp.]|nr:hypothetical protein [Flavobacterium sp.]HMI60193.1 hypothetical protein [Puia sp.]